MNKLIIIALMFALILTSCSSNNTQPSTQDDSAFISSLPFEELSSEEEETYNFIINEEYKAYELYNKIVIEFGEVSPFTKLKLSTQNNIDSLKILFQKYNVTFPENEWGLKISAPLNLDVACQLAKNKELEKSQTYNQMFNYVNNEDITYLLTVFRNKSKNENLVLLEKCGTY
jgi:hypothetical protein